MDVKYKKNGNYLQRLSTEKMKGILDSIQRTKTIRDYYAMDIEDAIREKILIVQNGEVIMNNKKSSSKKSPISKKSTRSPKLKSPVSKSSNSSSNSSTGSRSSNSSSNSSTSSRSSNSSSNSSTSSRSSNSSSNSSNSSSKSPSIGYWMKKEIEDYFKLTSKNDIGKGSYGKVIRATNEEDQTSYAIKIYDIEISKSDINANGCFAEAYYGELFDHPNIMKSLDFRMNKKNAYLVMDLADMDLGSYLKKKLPASEKIHLAYQIAGAIDYMHRGGFTNCDVKPVNILMIDGVPKITDLGLTRTDNIAVQEKFVCETNFYRSPEQYIDTVSGIYGYQQKYGDDRGKDDSTAEYWSVGICFLDLIYGENHITLNRDYSRILIKMFNDFEENGYSMFEAVQNQIGKTPNEEDNNLLSAVCKYLLRFDPSERSINAFMEDPIFDPYRIQAIPFVFPVVKKMYRGEIVSLELLNKMFIWMDRIGKIENIPPIILSNSIDFIIQHAHNYINKADHLTLLVICTLWVMERIFNAKTHEISMQKYLKYAENAYDEEDFMHMVLYIVNRGMQFESLYSYLPNDDLVQRGLVMMTFHTEDYIKFETPRRCAEYLKKTYGDNKGIKTNKSIILE